jgi:hypothetical protein
LTGAYNSFKDIIVKMKSLVSNIKLNEYIIKVPIVEAPRCPPKSLLSFLHFFYFLVNEWSHT